MKKRSGYFYSIKKGPKPLDLVNEKNFSLPYTLCRYSDGSIMVRIDGYSAMNREVITNLKALWLVQPVKVLLRRTGCVFKC